MIDVKGGATLAKHRFALAYGKHKVGKIKKSEPTRPLNTFGRDEWTRTTDPHLIRVVL